MAQKLNDAKKLLEIKLQALYDIEKQLERALPKMAKAAEDPILKEGFTSHLKETKEHSVRLEKAFKILDIKPKKLKSEGIRGIIADGEWVMEATGESVLKDAMLASAARYVEHYEMAGYLSACELAHSLGLGEIEKMLRETLAEEENADVKLTGAMLDNIEASMSSEEGEDIV